MKAHQKHCPCPECVERRAARPSPAAVIIAVLLGLCVLLAILLCTGCSSSVTPEAVHSAQASFDGGEQNSGILAAQPGGFSVTAHFRDRYNALVGIYGREFAPPLQPNEGLLPLTDDVWFIDAGHLVKFLQMNTWKKSGRLPSIK